MANLPPVYTVLEALVACGVDNANNFNGNTPAWRLSNELFSDDFESCLDKTQQELDDDLKSYSTLTQLQGQIRILPGCRKNIKAFIQWSKDQIRTGVDPSTIPFPMGNVTDLLRRSRSHDLFIKKSSMISDTAKPARFTEKMKWEDWNPSFVNFLRSIPGRNGIPLSYVIRTNPLPDPVAHTDFLDDYVAMASLTGSAFEVDRAEVHTYIVKFISGNDTAESKIQGHTITNNGREDHIALKNHYEGIGVNSVDILRADAILEKLNYTGEKPPHMWWDEFEKQLNFAFTAYAKSEGRDIYSESMKLRILTKKVNADFLSHTNASILTHMTAIPMMMTYVQALATFRQMVNKKHPPGTIKSTRRINETARGRGGRIPFRGRGGRGGRGGRHGRGGRNGRQHVKHPQSYPVTLTNGRIVDIHSLYYVGPEIWSHMSEPDRTRLTHERALYKRESADRTLAALSHQSYSPNQYALQHQQIAPPYVNTNASVQQTYTIPPYPSQIQIPPPPPATGAQLQSSQVSAMSRGSGTFMGGRNERAAQSDRHNQGAP